MSEILCLECYEDGNCGRSVRDCPAQKAAALDAGIPLSVIEGRTKLTDHFTRETIDRMCGREPADEEFCDQFGRVLR